MLFNAMLFFPVWVVRYGKSDMKGILCSAKKKDYLLHVRKKIQNDYNLMALFLKFSYENRLYNSGD